MVKHLYTAAAVGLATAVLLAPTAHANHNTGPYLSAGEASRVAARILYKEWPNAIQKGSGRFECPRTPGHRDFRHCFVNYLDRGHHEWCTGINIRKTPSWDYRYRVVYDYRC